MKLSLSVFISLILNSSVVVSAAEAVLQKGTYSTSAGSRDYYLYVPDRITEKPAVVVALHGCTQTAPDFAAQSGFVDLADNYGFIAVFPEQSYKQNAFKCWNWFKPESQQRSAGEASIIVDLTKKLIRDTNADGTRVYVVGLSAGAAMAANLFACYSDLFSGLGIHSGLEYRAAQNEIDAQNAMKFGSPQNLSNSAVEAVACTGSGAKTGRVAIFHGSEDNVVNPVNASRAVSQFTKINDLLDDGSENGSHTLSVISTQTNIAPGGYRYVTEDFGSAAGAVLIRQISIKGMKHAWSGAHRQGQFSDPKGPDAAEIFWNFMAEGL